MNKSTNETGASMVEILGVLAVVATIAVGMFTGISRMNQKIKLTQAQTEITDIVKAMRTQFSSFTPSSITSKGLYDVGIFKNVNDEGKSANVYGTEMLMELKSDVENPYFTFIYKDIPTSVCADLLLGDWGNDPSSGLREIKVQGTGKTSIFQWEKDIRPVDEENPDAPTSQPLLPSLEKAIDACTLPSGSGIVTISWSYYI